MNQILFFCFDRNFQTWLSQKSSVSVATRTKLICCNPRKKDSSPDVRSNELFAKAITCCHLFVIAVTRVDTLSQGEIDKIKRLQENDRKGQYRFLRDLRGGGAFVNTSFNDVGKCGPRVTKLGYVYLCGFQDTSGTGMSSGARWRKSTATSPRRWVTV